ncbi:MAG: PAS domain S-box protein [Deltaproteobacteria bacterium]|nr:PAS domain S-box protein [Deltaproteobacteria bacterium]
MGIKKRDRKLEQSIENLEKELARLRQEEETLREREERCRTLFDKGPDLIIVIDTQGTILDLNETFEKETGYSRDEFIGKNVFEANLLTKESLAKTLTYMESLLKGETWPIFEIEGISNNNRIIPFELRAVPIRKDGEIVAIEAILRNIAERKRAQEAFRKENEKFQLLVEKSPMAVSIIDKNGGYKYVNPRFTEILGYTLEDIPTGREWFLKAFPDEKLRKEAISVWVKDLEKYGKGEFRPRIFEVTCKDGSRKIVEFKSVTMDSGEQLVIYGDVTELKKAEWALAESEERYRSVFENTGTAMGIFEEDMTIAMANAELEKLSGYSKQELEGKMKWTEFVAEEDLERMKRYHAERREKGGKAPGEYEFTLVDKYGKRKTIFTKVAIIPGTGRNVSSLTDITARKKAEQALQASEEKYRTILENIEEGYFEVDLGGNLTFFNDSLCKISGYPPEELLGMNNREYTSPETAKKMYRVFNRVYRTGKPARILEYEIKRKDGSSCYLEMSTTLMKDSSGTPIGFRGIVRDITERKRAEQALRESEERYRQLVEHAPAGIYEVDFTTQKFVSVNDVMCEYTGYTKEEFLNLSPLDILPPESKRRFLERLSKIVAGEKVPEVVEYQIRGKGGREFWVMLNTRLTYENGIHKGATVVVYDITERRKAEEALRKSEERYRLLVENATDGIFITQKGRIRFPNPKTLEVLGYTAEELAKMWYVDLIHPEDRSGFMERLKKRRGSEKGPDTYTIRIINKAGEELWAQINSVPITWEGRAAALNFVRDITPQKRLEEQLMHAQKMEAIGTIASGVAHNFRNILAVISMKSQVIDMKYRDHAELRNIAEGINNYVERGVKLVEGLMQFCRKQARKEFQPLDLCSVIHETYQIISKSFDKMIDIGLSIPPSLPIMGDSAALSQVFMNLFSNARDAMPEGGRLQIDAEREGDYAVVSVSDTGHGMARSTLEKCFDPFFTTKDIDKGTGLGLSTAYGIVKEHGGEIKVTSKQGKGTTFRLLFPLDSSKELSEEKTPLRPVSGRGQQVLIVDDEIEICKVMKELLKEFGYRASYVTSGKEGIAAYKTSKPDLLLVDRSMPEMDGISFAREIMDLDPDAKIVIISGYDQDGPSGIDEQARHLIKGYLTKPVNVKELSGIMAKLLQ